MSKAILLIIILLLAYWIIYLRPRSEANKKTPQTGKPESMVACSYCGVFIPQSDAVLVGDRSYCSQDHCIRDIR